MNDHRPAEYRGVLFLGAPGSGKGTQSQAIGALPGFFSFSTGQVLRGLDADSDLGHRVRGYLTRGDLVPNEIVLEVWQSHMRAAVDEGRFTPGHDVLLLDAYPRDHDQAKLLRPHIDIQLVVHLSVDNDEVLKQRIRDRDARPDDRDEEIIDHRFQVYRRRTEPLLENFGHKQIVPINAHADPLQVLSDIVQAILNRNLQ